MTRGLQMHLDRIVEMDANQGRTVKSGDKLQIRATKAIPEAPQRHSALVVQT